MRRDLELVTPPVKATVVGAGIAGCAAAIVLARLGIEVEVFERRTAGDLEEGQFLTVAPNGMRVLDALGLGDAARSVGRATGVLRFLSAAGAQLGRVSVSAGAEPGVTLRRRELFELLRAAAQGSGARIRYGAGLRAIDHAGRPIAGFDDGRVSACDLLIGADGLRSRVRQVLFPEVPSPRASGLGGCSGFSRARAAATPTGEMQMVFGHHAFFGWIGGGDGEPVYWFSTVDAAALRERRSQGQQALRPWLLEQHAADGALVRRIIEATPFIATHEIHDMPALPRWSQGACLLVGDAAHATSPHGGQGASMALEDAWCLGALLKPGLGATAIGDAPAAFEALRRPRVERIVAWSARNGARKVPSSQVSRWLRDRTMPLALKLFASPRAHAWVYDFDPRSALAGAPVVRA